jgi:hypothetical protein
MRARSFALSRTLSRRACLRGLGVAVGLPWLEAMAPRSARAAGPKPLRLLTVFAPHGIHMPAWRPAAAGEAFTLPPILEPLKDLRGELNVISGLANYPASITTKEFAGSHARGAGALLTQTPLRFTAGKDIQNGISLDQVIASEMKQYTRLPSLELGVSSGSATGNCEDGYSCAYLHNLSWSGPTTFMPKETSPRAVFTRLFGSGAPAATPTMPGAPPRPDKDVLYRRGILDLVRGEVTRLGARLGRSDKAKLDEYLTSVGELDRRLSTFDQGTAPPAAQSCQPGAAPSDAAPASYEEHLRLLSDVIVLAFQCDLTRVVTFMQEDPFNSRSFAFLGVSGNHHNLSHHGGNAAKQAAQQKINTFEITQFAYLLAKLKNAREGNESVLDNSIVMFTSEFGDGDDHYHWDLPVLVAGRAGGRFKPGRHIVYPHKGADGPANKTDMPMANLFVSILQAFGLAAQTFGTDGTQAYGTRPLAELAG